MTLSLHALMLLLHLLAAVAWVGGMFFAHFCLRPSAAQVLLPPQRIPLLVATFQRFFRIVAVAALVELATGLWLLGRVGMAQAPLGWHVMLTLGLVMVLVFSYIYAVLFPRLRAHAAASVWPAAAQVMASIRLLVAFNLVLGVAAIVAAALARG